MDTGSTLHRTVSLVLLAAMIGPVTGPQPTTEGLTPAPISRLETTRESVVPAAEQPAAESPIDPRVSTAADRFISAGMDFPEVEVLFHDSTDGCHGHVGLFTGDQVHVCVKEEGLYQQRTLLHELAHAWADQNLSIEKRLVFMDLRDTTSWNDPQVEWKHRGSEQLAEIVAWGLLEIPTTPFKIPNHECENLSEAFELAVGEPVPRTDVCH